jgi:hypothetical protein
VGGGGGGGEEEEEEEEGRGGRAVTGVCVGEALPQSKSPRQRSRV